MQPHLWFFFNFAKTALSQSNNVPRLAENMCKNKVDPGTPAEKKNREGAAMLVAYLA